MPERIQLRRTKGWRKPEGAVVVARPSKWGNPYRVERKSWTMRNGRLVESEWAVLFHDDGGSPFEDQITACLSVWPTLAEAIVEAVRLFRARLCDVVPETGFPVDPWMQRDIVEHLAGKDLACWCPPDQPCHADVLLEIANSPTW